MQIPPSVDTRILLIDDHPLFVAGFVNMATILRPGWQLTTQASAEAALGQIESGEMFDLVLIDLTLPGMDGFDLLGRLARAWPQIIRVIISGREDKVTRLRARACGASAYIPKNLPPERMAAVLDEVLAGQIHFIGPLAGDEDLSDSALTPRQAEVLSMLALGASNKEIERKLKISDRTVRAHLTDIFVALKVQSRTQAILEAQKRGLVS